MSGVGSRETGLDSLFASKPIGPGFEPCLGQSTSWLERRNHSVCHPVSQDVILTFYDVMSDVQCRSCLHRGEGGQKFGHHPWLQSCGPWVWIILGEDNNRCCAEHLIIQAGWNGCNICFFLGSL